MATAFTPTVFSPQGKADYRINPVAGVEYKPQDGMTQLNQILDYQGKNLELQKAQALLQPSIEKGKAEAAQAQTQLNTSQLENIIKHSNNIITNIQPLMLKQDLNIDDVTNMATKTVKNAGGDEKAVQQTLLSLPKNPTSANLRAWLAQQQVKAAGAVTAVEKLYPGGVLPGQLPETTPEAGTQQQMGGQGTETIGSNMDLQYPVRNPNVPYLPVQGEKESADVGALYTSHANQIAGKLPQTVRNNKELIGSIKELQKGVPELFQGGMGGEARLALLKAQGDPRVSQLQKNLDNVISSTVTAFGKEGLATDAGKQLTAASVGKLNMPLDVLLNTAYRASGDLKNSELEAKAVSKFTKQFGVNNIASFQKAWGDNADREVLQLKAMQDMGADEKDIDEFVFKGKTKDQIKELIKKEKNLDKLVDKGHL